MKVSLLSIYPDIESFGVRTLSACLKKEGHTVDLFFLTKQFYQPFEEKTLDDLVKLTKDSNLIGISLMSNFWDNAIQITKKLKENYETPILWGGTHPTVRPDECLDHADMVCIGESEETLLELTRKMEKGQYYYDTKGMGFRTNEKKINNGHRPLPGSKGSSFKSLDEIPIQDYDYKNHYSLNMTDYVLQKGDGSIRKMNVKDMESFGGTYMTQPTRGCPFACTFCVNNATLAMYPHQKPIRKRSVDHIIKELLEVKANLPHINKIKFDDDAFFLHSLNDIKDFAKQYKEKIKIPLMITGATPSTLKRDKLDVLVDAGLTEMRMGIQTAGERTKVLYKRPHTNEEVENAVTMVNDHKDKIKKVFYDIILDSPWDTEQDNIETLMFLSKLPTPYVLNLFSLVFYPGTDLYRKAKKEGIVKNDINDIYHRYYHGCKPTYLNSLHSLLHDYVSIDIGISPKIMALLINKKMRLLKLNWILFWILKMLNPLFKIVRFAQQVLRDVLKGNWSAVKNNLQIYKWYQRKKARIAYDFSLGLKKISNSIKVKS
jgi:radical SAM superfamily enzyme YgiQ (UPF0313 family)